ncbi:MAG: peroxidase-related enzyme [Candidatus Poribacteria bacterium]|nr:peroxidase-related enzyme [Candidatus Poribacteria bacterium]
MYLKQVAADTDSDALRRLREQGGSVPEILHLFAYKSHTRHLGRFVEGVMRGESPLSPGLREMIAAFVSGRNECAFCHRSHTEAAAQLVGERDVVLGAMADYRAASLSEKERALFTFVEKVVTAAQQVRQEDVDAVLDAGWSEEALYDAITVCAVFQFFNTWVGASGVADMTPLEYAQSGARLATLGYAREDESGS